MLWVQGAACCCSQHQTDRQTNRQTDQHTCCGAVVALRLLWWLEQQSLQGVNKCLDIMHQHWEGGLDGCCCCCCLVVLGALLLQQLLHELVCCLQPPVGAGVCAGNTLHQHTAPKQQQQCMPAKTDRLTEGGVGSCWSTDGWRRTDPCSRWCWFHCCCCWELARPLLLLLLPPGAAAIASCCNHHSLLQHLFMTSHHLCDPCGRRMWLGKPRVATANCMTNRGHNPTQTDSLRLAHSTPELTNPLLFDELAG